MQIIRCRNGWKLLEEEEESFFWKLFSKSGYDFKARTKQAKTQCSNHYMNIQIYNTFFCDLNASTPKFTSGTLKESLYQIRRKFIEWKLHDRIRKKIQTNK